MDNTLPFHSAPPPNQLLRGAAVRATPLNASAPCFGLFYRPTRTVNKVAAYQGLVAICR